VTGTSPLRSLRSASVGMTKLWWAGGGATGLEHYHDRFRLYQKMRRRVVLDARTSMGTFCGWLLKSTVFLAAIASTATAAKNDLERAELLQAG
jgi:hypothetical protein